MRPLFGSAWELPEVRPFLDEIIGDWKPPRFNPLLSDIPNVVSRIVEDAFVLNLMRRRWWDTRWLYWDLCDLRLSDGQRRMVHLAERLGCYGKSDDLDDIVTSLICNEDLGSEYAVERRERNMVKEHAMVFLKLMDPVATQLLREHGISYEKLYMAKGRRKTTTDKSILRARADLVIETDDVGNLNPKILDLKFRKSGGLAARDVRQMVFLRVLVEQGSEDHIGRDPEIVLTSHGESVLVPVESMKSRNVRAWEDLQTAVNE